jgi:hypothetical protein
MCVELDFVSGGLVYSETENNDPESVSGLTERHKAIVEQFQ